jgi:hypothetical protein
MDGVVFMAKNKFGKWEFSEAELNKQIEKANKRGQESLKNEPQASRAVFNEQENLIMIYLKNGCVFGFPPGLIKELQDAETDKIAQISISPQGTGLHWEVLDADYSVTGLLNGVFGTKTWMKELGRKGGKVRSKAKAKAARANGAKGGRPRKNKSAYHFQIEIPKTDFFSQIKDLDKYHTFKADIKNKDNELIAELLETKKYLEEPVVQENKKNITARILRFPKIENADSSKVNLKTDKKEIVELEEDYAIESFAA